MMKAQILFLISIGLSWSAMAQLYGGQYFGTTGTCPVPGLYVAIGTCTYANNHYCPPNAACWNEVCCASSGAQGSSLAITGYTGYGGIGINGMGLNGYGTCVGGMLSTTRCIPMGGGIVNTFNSGCQQGQYCTAAGWCCPQTGVFPNSGGTGIGTCFNGQSTGIPCQVGIPNSCQMGQQCQNGICCIVSGNMGQGGTCYNGQSTGIPCQMGIPNSCQMGQQCQNGICCIMSGNMGQGAMCQQNGAGQFSTLPCIGGIGGRCPMATQICELSGYCCPPTSTFGGNTVPFGNTGTCPDGHPPLGSCYDGVCTALPNLGQLICVGTVCCSTTTMMGGRRQYSESTVHNDTTEDQASTIE